MILQNICRVFLNSSRRKVTGQDVCHQNQVADVYDVVAVDVAHDRGSSRKDRSRQFADFRAARIFQGDSEFASGNCAILIVDRVLNGNAVSASPHRQPDGAFEIIELPGGNGDGEHFFPPADFVRHLGSAKTMETCCTHNMLKLTRRLFALAPSAAYADYYERALYNSILASQDPDSGMMTYFQPTRPGYLKLYCTPTDSFWCCTGSGMENHAKYGDSIYFRGTDSLYVNLFIPSTVTWKEKGLTVTQTTRFPEQDKTRLRLAVQKPMRLSLNIRHPFWCQIATVFINGYRHTTSREPGRYIAISRVWRAGDTVEMHLPMTLRTEHLPGQPDVVAFMYGPLVLAGRLGREGIAPGADIIVNERTTGNVLKADVKVPMLVGELGQIASHISPTTGAALRFQTEGIGHPHDVNLIPYYRITHERYNLYWKVVKREDSEKI